MFMSLHFLQLSFPTLGSVDASFRMAHALGGSTREQSHVPHSCNKGLCSATRQHWHSSSLPKMQMPPSLPTFPSHSQTQFWPFAQAGDCSHLTHEWVQLTNYRMHPSNPRLLPADGAELASHWQQHQCNRSSRSARLEVGSSCWKHWHIRMSQHLRGLSHKYLAEQKLLRGCSMHPAFNTHPILIPLASCLARSKSRRWH